MGCNHYRRRGWPRLGAYWRRWWGLSSAYTHRAALGISETDSSPLCTLHIGKFDRRGCRRHVVGQTPTAKTWLYALAAFAGAVLGTSFGLRWLSQTMTRHTLAAILGAAGIQLLFF
jgi:hypothetical protein